VQLRALQATVRCRTIVVDACRSALHFAAVWIAANTLRPGDKPCLDVCGGAAAAPSILRAHCDDKPAQPTRATWYDSVVVRDEEPRTRRKRSSSTPHAAEMGERRA
jgi:hypothetical protein